MATAGYVRPIDYSARTADGKRTQAYKEWKKGALWFIQYARGLESGGRLDREYAGYVKRFFFGEHDWSDLQCAEWKRAEEAGLLPMSFNTWWIE